MIGVRTQFVAMVACCSIASLEGGCATMQLQYAPAIVRLSGVVVAEEHYGPPNFGETPNADARLQVLVLHLDRPLAVAGRPGGEFQRDSLNAVRRVQLYPVEGLQLGLLVGRHVTLEGTLLEGYTAAQFTKVTMDVRRVVSGRH